MLGEHASGVPSPPTAHGGETVRELLEQDGGLFMSEIIETHSGFLVNGSIYPKTRKGLQSMMKDEVLAHLDWAGDEENKAAQIIDMAFELGRVSAIETTEKPDFLSDEFLTKTTVHFNLFEIKRQNLYVEIASLFYRGALSLLSIQHPDGGRDV